jgi:DNA recombination protein RmuC
LVEAQEKGDRDAVEAATHALEQSIVRCAKDISEKYIHPPVTTNFAFMYLPNEGLFAEAVRRQGLVERLQRDYRVAIAGPTTLAANLNMIQMGFRTLAIEKQTTEVWNLLGAVKTQFGLFGGVLDKVKRQLNTASNSIEEVGVRSRAIEKRLRRVEELPEEEAVLLLPETVFLEEESSIDDRATELEVSRV